VQEKGVFHRERASAKDTGHTGETPANMLEHREANTHFPRPVLASGGGVDEHSCRGTPEMVGIEPAQDFNRARPQACLNCVTLSIGFTGQL
jgi:hypothetical protein